MSTYIPFFFFFQAEDGIRDIGVTGVQTCALPILCASAGPRSEQQDNRRREHPQTERGPADAHKAWRRFRCWHVNSVSYPTRFQQNSILPPAPSLRCARCFVAATTGYLMEHRRTSFRFCRCVSPPLSELRVVSVQL